MRKLFSALTITLLTTQGLLLLPALSQAEALPISEHQPLLLAFDGFDDDGGGDMSADDSNNDDTMDDSSSPSSSSSSSEPSEGGETPDAGFHTGYSQDNE